MKLVTCYLWYTYSLNSAVQQPKQLKQDCWIDCQDHFVEERIVASQLLLLFFRFCNAAAVASKSSSSSFKWKSAQNDAHVSTLSPSLSFSLWHTNTHFIILYLTQAIFISQTESLFLCFHSPCIVLSYLSLYSTYLLATRSLYDTQTNADVFFLISFSNPFTLIFQICKVFRFSLPTYLANYLPI